MLTQKGSESRVEAQAQVYFRSVLFQVPVNSNKLCKAEAVADPSHYMGTLLNDWLQNGNPEARQMYDEALEALFKNRMVRELPNSKFWLVALKNENGWIENVMTYNSCMAGGIFGLGALSDPGRANSSRDYLALAKELTYTCYHVSTKTQAKLRKL